MRALVTGAGGFLGAALVRLLLRRGVETAALLRPGREAERLSPLPESLRILRGNCFRPEDCAEEIRRFAPDTVFHLAWSRVHGPSRNRPDLLGENLRGTLDLFRVLESAGCRNWIGCGSQAENPIIRGEDPARWTPYGLEKRTTGLLLRGLARWTGSRLVWLRLFAAYGPGDDPTCFIPGLIRHLADSGESPPLTAGTQRWDYLYGDDAAEALAVCGAQTDLEGDFELGSGEAVPIRTIAEKIRDLLAPGATLRFGERPTPPEHPEILRADPRPLRERTGWTPRVSLDEGLRRTVAGFLASRGGALPTEGGAGA
jgi:nucleoside-diphosphate-sugar epimerase